jgi:endonuclease/exonuclease/phosphatase family metal-dependent hydrolase
MNDGFNLLNFHPLKISGRSTFICLMLAFASFTVSAQHPIDSSRIVRVLTFNILHGATTHGDFDLDVIANVINTVNPDLVALQEVDFKTNRAKKYDLATELGWRTHMVSLFARAMYYDDGEYGEAVLSDYTLLNSRNVALPHQVGSEPRAALEILCALGSGDTIAFIGTHLDHLNDETDRVAQAKKLNEVFGTNKYPTIMAGDFNAIPGSAPINLLEEIWMPSFRRDRLAFTFPSNGPVKKIDYIMFYPKNRWRVLETEVICDTIASDHCAYLAALELLVD